VLIRDDLEMLLSLEKDIDVVDQAGDGAEAFRSAGIGIPAPSPRSIREKDFGSFQQHACQYSCLHYPANLALASSS